MYILSTFLGFLCLLFFIASMYFHSKASDATHKRNKELSELKVNKELVMELEFQLRAATTHNRTIEHTLDTVSDAYNRLSERFKFEMEEKATRNRKADPVNIEAVDDTLLNWIGEK